jgi:C4-dicarboxylate-specific signal transduction histidine kinase
MTTPRPVTEAALTAMAGWVASIADNINNPVTAVTAAVTLVSREIEELRTSGSCRLDFVEETLARIQDRLVRVSDYVGELAAVARPSLPRPARVPLVAALRDARPSKVYPEDVAVDVDLAPDAAHVDADPSQLRTTLRALLNNALEAARSTGAPALAVRARRDVHDGRAGVTLTVEDNGPGFAPHARVRAVEPFFSTKEAGSGLGLALADRFATAHGGALWIAASTALGGAAVSMFLPDRTPVAPTTEGDCP